MGNYAGLLRLAEEPTPAPARRYVLRGGQVIDTATGAPVPAGSPEYTAALQSAQAEQGQEGAAAAPRSRYAGLIHLAPGADSPEPPRVSEGQPDRLAGARAVVEAARGPAPAGMLPTSSAEDIGEDPGAFMPAARQAALAIGGPLFGMAERAGGLARESPIGAAWLGAAAPALADIEPGTYAQMKEDLEAERVAAMAHGHTGAQAAGLGAGIVGSALLPVGGAKAGAAAGTALPRIGAKLGGVIGGTAEGALTGFGESAGAPVGEQVKATALGAAVGLLPGAAALVPAGRLNPLIGARRGTAAATGGLGDGGTARVESPEAMTALLAREELDVPRGTPPEGPGPYPPGKPGPVSTKGVTNVAGMREELGELAAKHEDLIQQERGGRQSMGQYHDAQELADNLGMTLTDFLDTPPGKVLGSREVALGKSLLGGLRNQVKSLSDELASGRLDETAAGAAKDKLAATQADLVGLMVTLQARGSSEWGRGLRSLQETLEPLAASETERLQLAVGKHFRGQLDGPDGDDLIRRMSLLDASRPDEVIGFLRQTLKPRFNQYRASYWFGSVLSGTKTLLRNGIGNAVKLATDTVMRPAAAGTDAALSRMTGAERTRYTAETMPAIVGIWRGVPKGIERFAYVMRNGYDPERLIQDLIEGEPGKWEGGRLPIDPFVLSSSPTVRKVGAALNIGPRLLLATDALTRSMADSSERYAWATRQAMTDVKAGKASSVADRAAELLVEQPEEMVRAARSFAAKTTYTDPMSWVGEAAQGLRRKTGVIGEALLPFVHVSDRVAAGVSDFIPGSKPRKLVEVVKAGGPEAADLVARQVVGGALGMAGLALAYQGRLVGAAPKDKKKRDDFYSEGKQPYSVLLGGRWTPIRDMLGPLAGPFVAAAVIHDNWQGGSIPEKAMRAVGGGSLETARYMLDASYLHALQEVVGSITEERGNVGRGVVQTGARYVGGYAPWSGFERNVATAMDPRVVEREGFIDELRSGIPGLRNTLPARTNDQGEPLIINTGRLGGFSPVVPTASQIADPALAEEVESARASLQMQATALRKLKERIETAGKGQDYRRVRELMTSNPEYELATYAKNKLESIQGAEKRLRELRRTTPAAARQAEELALYRSMLADANEALQRIQGMRR